MIPVRRRRKMAKRVMRKKMVRRKAPLARRISEVHTFKRLGYQLTLVNGNTNPPTSAGVIDQTPAPNLPAYNQGSVGIIGGAGNNSYVQIPFAFQFNLTNVQNFTEFTTLFDQYKIVAVKVEFMNGSNYASVAGGGVLPYITFIRDYDDATPIIDFGATRERQTFKEKRFSGTRSITVRPKPAQQVYQAAMTSAYMTPNTSGWIDCENPAVPHYGLKGWIRNQNWGVRTAAVYTEVTVNLTYYVAFRTVV